MTRHFYHLVLIGFWILAVSSPQAQAQLSEASEACLMCHGESEMRETTFAFSSGRSLSVFVDSPTFQRSTHGAMDCGDCHTEFSEDDHPSREFSSRASYRQSLSEACENCHFFEGIHSRLVERPDSGTCVDCHGAHSVGPIETTEETCLGCHSREMQITFEDGETHPIFCESDQFDKSVHAKLRCVDCHFGFSSKEHPDREFKSHREMTQLLSENCRRCHFDKYTRTLESVHYEVRTEEHKDTPVCADCHGTHAIQSGDNDKRKAATKCQKCHSEIYSTYVQSVHGQGLQADGTPDVPICSDCHEAHKIRDPKLIDFRNQIPQMCGDCHANEEVMERYGLSTAVLDSYLEDFHGVTLTFYQKEDDPVRHIAVCTDCHGIHDIVSLRERDSEVVKSSLLQRCQSCHDDATANFPDTWISHYEPTLTRAPLVYLVHLFYKFFIPFMMTGLVLQILLHIWRYAFNR